MLIEMDMMSVFSNPLVMVLGLATLIIGYNTFIKKGLSSDLFPKQVLYFSKDNQFGEQLKGDTETPKIVRTKNGYKFIKNKRGIPFNIDGKTVIRWLAKMGKAWTYDLENALTVKDKYSLWDILQVVLTDNELKNLKPKLKERLEKSDIKMCIGLEEHIDEQTKEEPLTISEQEVLGESAKNMAKLISESVEEGFRREDYIKIVALVGLGVALTYILQGLKILPKV